MGGGMSGRRPFARRLGGVVCRQGKTRIDCPTMNTSGAMVSRLGVMVKGFVVSGGRGDEYQRNEGTKQETG